MKKILFLLTVCFYTVSAYAQKNYYIEPKLNVASAAIGIVNPSLEIGFADRSAVTFDYIGAYAKDNYLGTGSPLLLSIVTFEYRAYLLNKEHKGFFAGANLGVGNYKMEKSIIPFLQHKQDGMYDWGMAVTLGLTLGYKVLINERFGVEFSATGGWQHSQHEKYYENGNIRATMNASGEWTAIKAGVMFSYRF